MSVLSLDDGHRGAPVEDHAAQYPSPRWACGSSAGRPTKAVRLRGKHGPLRAFFGLWRLGLTPRLMRAPMHAGAAFATLLRALDQLLSRHLAQSRMTARRFLLAAAGVTIAPPP